jgi:hypothetical protein
MLLRDFCRQGQVELAPGRFPTRADQRYHAGTFANSEQSPSAIVG